MKNNNRAPQKPSGKSSGTPLALKRAPIHFIALAMMGVVILTMIIMCLVPGAGKNPKNPTLVIYGDKGNVPNLSLTNTLHAAGFEYVIADYGEDISSYGTVVLAAMGSDALSIINDHKDDPHVAGFILICPEYNETYMTGLTSGNPTCDIAIFAGRNKCKGTKDMSAARVIYERLSGDDTLYGIPVKRGGLFASEVYVNNAQNRMLSLSCFSVRDPQKLLFSPLFQNELAGYLSVTYIDESTREVSFGRINSWFVFSWLVIMFSIVSVLLFLSNIKLDESGYDTKKAPVSKWVFGFIGGISIAVAIGIVASTSVTQILNALLWILTLVPTVFMACLFGINFKWIYAKEGKFIPRKTSLVPTLFISVVIGLMIMFTLAMTADLKVHAIKDAGLSAAILGVIFVADLIVTTGLIYASRKSTVAGQGAKNCFGNKNIFGLMFMPCIVALLYGLLPGHSQVFYCGLAGLAATGIPFLAVLPIVRHSDRSLIAGVLHGIIYILVIAAIL